MRKFNTNKLAALLTALCIATSAFVGSTLAKYVSKSTASDSARVSKWGVTIELSGSSFGTEYKNTGDKVTVKVDPASSGNIVAPGTADSEGSKIHIDGIPEVEAKVTAAMPVMQDIFLKAGTYRDYTSSDPNATFTLAEDYHPIRFTIKLEEGEYYDPVPPNDRIDASTKPYYPVQDAPLSAVKDFLEHGVGMDYPAGTNMHSISRLFWEWPFDGNNAADTLLAKIMSGEVTNVSADKYNTTIAYEIDYIIEQVD